MASSARSRSWLDITAVGGAAMQRDLRELGRTGIQEQVIAPTLNEAIDVVYADVERRIPTRSGGLKSTLRKFVSKTRARVVVGNAKEIHGRFLEFGTSKMPARPFMRPALDGNRRRIEAIAAKHLQRAVARLGHGGSVATTGGRGRYRRSKAA